MTLTREQIELQRQRYLWMMSGDSGSVPPPNIKLTLSQEVELCDLALKGLQVEAMREAIRRALAALNINANPGVIAEIRADLEQALKMNEEGK